jgi:hypothetical protein
MLRPVAAGSGGRRAIRVMRVILARYKLPKRQIRQ